MYWRRATTAGRGKPLALPLPKGMLLAELSLEHFKELALPPEITDKASLYITDQQGTYLYHEDSLHKAGAQLLRTLCARV